jgi:hypothetical protein
MTQLTIVTTPQNSGDGTPLATAFNYCNSNFNELYARAQTTPPATLTGSVGDSAGMYAYDPTYFYYCFADYDGSSVIWAQITQVNNVTINSISSGLSNVRIAGISGNAVTSIAGVSNVVVVSIAGQFVSGVVSATGNIRGSYILGNGSQLTGLPATYDNSNVISLLSTFGSNVISTTGNISSGNINSVRVSAAGNVAGGNLTTSGRVSATGNIVTDQYFVGNFFGNITGNFVIPGSNTQVVFNTNGNADATAGFTFDTAGPNLLTVLGTISSQGNTISGNLITSGQVSATGNITSGNLIGTNIIGTLSTVAQNNITSVGTLSSLNVTANVAGGNLTTSGQVSATGNIRTANNVSVGQSVNVGGDVTATSYTGTSASLSGNITSGNIVTGGIISTTGNIQSANINAIGRISATGNIVGAFISSAGGNIGVPVGVTTMRLGHETPTTIFIGGNATNIFMANVNSTTAVAGNLTVASNIVATGNITGSRILGNAQQLGNVGQSYAVTNVNAANYIFNGLDNDPTITLIRGQTYYFNIAVGATHPFWIKTAPTLGTSDAYSDGVVNNGITQGTLTFRVPWNAPSLLYYQCQLHAGMGGSLQVIDGTMLRNGTSNLMVYNDGNIATTVAGTANVTVVTSAGLVVGNIINANGNGVGNIGSSSLYFNTVFATATTALYADLAENYLADTDYAPGTVVVFGGEQEITVTTEAADERVAGVVSTNPAYLMNSGEPGLPIALRGKVPVRVVGPVTKGDSLVTSTTPGVAFSVGRERIYGQAVFAKSLESNNSDDEKVILAVII